MIGEHGAADNISKNSFSKLHEAKLEWDEGEYKVGKKKWMGRKQM